MISIVTTGLFLVSADESLMKSFYNFTLTFGNTGSGLRRYRALRFRSQAGKRAIHRKKSAPRGKRPDLYAL